MIENTEPRTETADGQQWLPQQAQTQATAPVPYGAQPLAAYGIPSTAPRSVRSAAPAPASP